MIPMGFGAGVGRVGPYFEQGNWYRGGAVQMLFIAWISGEQNQVRPMFPANTSQEDLIRASRSFDLGEQPPPVDWSKALAHLPEMDIIKAAGGPTGVFADSMPVATGGRMIQRTPNDPAWYKGGLFHDNMVINTPGALVHVVVRRVDRSEPGHLQSRAEDGPAGDRQPAVRRDRAHAALRVQARDGGDRRGRAQHGRRAARLRRAHLRLVRHLPQGREDRPARHPAQGPLLHDGPQQVADREHLAAGGIEAAHLLPLERRPREHRERRRHPQHEAAGEGHVPTPSATTR